MSTKHYAAEPKQLTLLVDGELHPPPTDEAGGDLAGKRGEGIAGLFRPVAYPLGHRLRVGSGGGGRRGGGGEAPPGGGGCRRRDLRQARGGGVARTAEARGWDRATSRGVSAGPRGTLRRGGSDG